MKLLLTSSTIVMLITATLVGASFSSCTKERPDFKDFKNHRPSVDTVRIGDTIIIRDTVVIKDTMLTTEILIANAWKIDELIGVGGGDSVFYFRGGVSNTFNYDNDYIVFYNDGTGFSQDANGYSHLIKDWQFANDEHTKMTFKYYITNSSIYHDITWDNIRYKNKNLMYDEYYHDNYINVNVHDQTVRSPK